MNQDRLPCSLGLSRELLSAWRDQLLPTAEARRIDLHVPGCAACQQRLAQFAQIATDLVRQHEPDLRRQTWQSLQKRLSQKGQHPMRIPRAATLSGIIAATLLTLIVVLFALVLHQRLSGSTGPTTSATATSSATATTQATTTPGTASCATALPGAGPASAGASFTDLPLPANSVSTMPAQTGGGGAGQFTLYTIQMCTSSSSPAAITTFFTSLTAHSWLHSTTFPADGSFQSDCAAQSCWAKDVRYVSLQAPITDLGGGVARYHLLLATAPPAPDCSGTGNTYLPGYYYKLPDPNYTSTQVYADIPLPPLSRIVPNDASGGQRGYSICSAGTVASITAFMSQHLSSLGWTATGNGTWAKSGYSLTVLISSATNWLVGWHDPDIHP